MVRILIVEDEKVVAWHIQVALEKLGHVVVASVVSGKKAIEAAAETTPDLVLMDIHLKGKMTGIVAAEQIYSRFDIPVIYLTAYTDAATVQQALSSSPFGYLAKPLRVQDLQSTIQVTLHRHQQEQNLRHTQQWMTTLLTSIGDATIATNLDGVVTFINPVAEQLTGWQQQEALGKPINQVLELIHPDTGESVENPLLQAVQQDAVVRLLEDVLLRSKDGTERAVGDSAAPIKNADGDTVGGILIFQDHTERRQAEVMAQRLQTKRIIQLQDGITQLQQFISQIQSFQSLTEPVDQEVAQLAQLSPPLLDLPPDLNASPKRMPLTDQERVWLDRFKEEVFGAISYELRTPLTNMRMAAEMLQRIMSSLRNAELNPEIERNKALLWQYMEQYLQILQDEWQQEFNLINDLLEFQVPETLTEPLLWVSIDLPQWLPSIVAQFTETAARQRLTLTCHVPASLPPITSHLPSLERIVTELLTNACKHTPPDQQITVTAERRDNQLKLTVTNTGVEIPAHELEQIFQPLYRIVPRNVWRYRGAGLGLALVNKFVIRLRGEIWAESESGQTRLVVLLPLS